MRILIMGGTVFVGRHIAEAAIAAGHDVTLFHRGRTGADLFPSATHLTGDRNENLSALSVGQWDATIDVSAYFPRQVRSLADALGGRGGQYVFISSTSAYRSPVAPGFTEDAPLAELDDPASEELTDETYGGLKVACERAAIELFGGTGRASGTGSGTGGTGGTTVVRPTYVIGPHDESYRFTWWVERIARGGTVLAPGGAADPIQVIDARDLGSWVVSLVERSVTGIFHAVSPPPPYGFGDLLAAIAAEVAPPRTRLTWVDADFLVEFGESTETIPLWPGGDGEREINTADPARAAAAGLEPRPIRQSIAEIHAAELATPRNPPAGVGLAREREAELLAAWHAIQAAGPNQT
jgi:nucleoside-diphosphate-sugar epimerase